MADCEMNLDKSPAMDNSGVATLGFSGGEQDTQWLESSVSVQRGGIHPGTTKVLTFTNGIVTKPPLAAHPTDSLQWSVTAENDGNMSIIDASPLNGAWFALYSPNEEDKLTQEAYEGIMAVPHQKPAEIVEYNGRTWYLTQVGQSQEQNGTSGVLPWDGLFRDEYLYCEVQASQGHALDSTLHLARKDDPVYSVTITNEKSGYELPQTGGFGTMLIYLAGVALLLTAGMLSPRKKRNQT